MQHDNSRKFIFHQAQLRVQDSSQKLHLLRQSLEKCLIETNRENLQPPAGRTDGSEEPASPHSSTPSCPLSTSPSLLSIRPASLTGVNHLQFYIANKTEYFSVKMSLDEKGGEGSVLGGFKMSTRQILKSILRK